MVRKILLGVGAIALISLATVVSGQTPIGQGTPIRLAAADTSIAAFRKLDTDQDGRISPREAAANPRVAAAFSAADKDRDGFLSREEFEALSSTFATAPDVAASSPSGDHASDPSGDQPATGPNDTSR